MFQMIIGFALLASAVTANKVLLASIAPLPFVALRMLVAGVLLCALYYHRSPQLRLHYLLQDAPAVLLAALLTTCIPALCKAYALANLPSWKATFIGSIDPFVTAVYSFLLLDHRLSMRQLAGIICGFSGTITLCLWDISPMSLASLTHLWLPEAAAFSAVLVLRYGWMVAQGLLKRERYNPAELNGILMLVSGMFLTTGYAAYDYTWLKQIPLTMPFFLGMAYTIGVGNMLAYTLYAHALKRHTANLVSLVGFSVPLFVTLYGVGLLGEQLSPSFWLATALIALGVWLFYESSRRKPWL